VRLLDAVAAHVTWCAAGGTVTARRAAAARESVSQRDRRRPASGPRRWTGPMRTPRTRRIAVARGPYLPAGSSTTEAFAEVERISVAW